MFSILLVAAEPDPVARGVLERWGTPPSTGWFVDGAPIREINPTVGLLRRSGLHIHDDSLDLRLSADVRAARPTLVFPSIHRSERGDRCFTVHPLGNPGPSAEVGGVPRSLVETDPLRMTDALRRLTESAAGTGLEASFEATHHGPLLGLPAFFAEIGFGDDPGPSAAALDVLAKVLPQVQPADGDAIAVGVGGGHYAPHFTDLALKRRWAFGHLISRHALETMDVATARHAVTMTPGAQGALFARAADARTEVGAAMGPRLSDGAAARRISG
ncbi:MAG: D-aminoacyl-tRNA deacylase [Thermoplasmata archaeon]|nr:D-aminoacyl-tRNA deacylase [Thermoplasmata archaeon]